MMRASSLFVVAAGFLLCGAAQADGAKLFQEKTCWSCHGKDGKKTILPAYPKIAGQNAAYAERQMLDIKSGTRANGNSAAMKAVMDLVTEDEIKELAAYIASMK